MTAFFAEKQLRCEAVCGGFDASGWPGRAAWVQVTADQLAVNGTEIKAGDGLSITEPGQLEIAASEQAEFLLFDPTY